MEKHIKVHIGYIISILIVIIVILSTINFGKVPKLVELFSFALTISSIILAILAILYAVYSNNSFSQTIAKLDTASQNIAESTNLLSNISNGLEDRFQNIPMLLETIDKKTDSTQLLITQLSEKNVNPIEPTFIKSNEIEKENIKNIVNSSIIGVATLYALKLAKDSNRKIDFKDFGQKCDLNYDYITGFIQPLTSLGLIKIKYDKQEFELRKIIDIHDEIDANIVEQVEFLWNKYKDIDFMQFTLTRINAVRTYFDLPAKDITQNFS